MNSYLAKSRNLPRRTLIRKVAKILRTTPHNLPRLFSCNRINSKTETGSAMNQSANRRWCQLEIYIKTKMKWAEEVKFKLVGMQEWSPHQLWKLTNLLISSIPQGQFCSFSVGQREERKKLAWRRSRRMQGSNRRRISRRGCLWTPKVCEWGQQISPPSHAAKSMLKWPHNKSVEVIW